MNFAAKIILGGAIAASVGVVGVRAGRECCVTHGAHADGAKQLDGATQQVVLIVEGMHCATCPITVRVTLERLDGVKSAKVSMKEGKAFVDYDPTKVTPDRMAKAVTDAGYPTKVATDVKGL